MSSSEESSSEDDFIPVPRPQSPDVRSGPFTYGGDFYTGEGRIRANGRLRCDSERLMNLLTYVAPAPLLTKKGKPRVRQPAPHVDESEDFYAAQLLHYGLEKSSEGKEADKKILLEYARRNGGKFVVPAEIVEMTGKMEREWDVEERRYMEECKVASERREEMEVKREGKRKRREEELLDRAFGGEYSGKRAKVEESKPITLNSLPGVYKIVAPALSENWNCDPLTIELCLSSTGSHMWGVFNFGFLRGRLRSEKLDKSSPFKGTIKFDWRGRETGEGESTIEPENIINLNFLDDGMFRGEMHTTYIETFKLAGKKNVRETQRTDLPSKVSDWKRGYRKLNEANYDAECSNRWSSWKTDAKPDKPEESDTTVGVDDSDDEEDEYGGGSLGVYY